MPSQPSYFTPCESAYLMYTSSQTATAVDRFAAAAWGCKSLFIGGVYALDEWQHEAALLKGPIPGSTPTTPLFDIPYGYEMREWGEPGGCVRGNVIYVPKGPNRPYIEAHECGHAWNTYLGGVPMGVDELQACLTGARFIINSSYSVEEYWGLMTPYLTLLGLETTEHGYVFSRELEQVEAAQFAWSVANGDVLLASVLAMPV